MTGDQRRVSGRGTVRKGPRKGRTGESKLFGHQEGVPEGGARKQRTAKSQRQTGRRASLARVSQLGEALLHTYLMPLPPGSSEPASQVYLKAMKEAQEVKASCTRPSKLLPSGLLTSNQPKQVVWLSRESRSRETTCRFVEGIPVPGWETEGSHQPRRLSPETTCRFLLLHTTLASSGPAVNQNRVCVLDECSLP